jgi:hypothetical protein
MKGKLLRACLLLACLTLALPLSGSPAIRAEENRQQTGMIQCLAASRDALMTLEFPAGGGAVTGQYLVSYTAHDTSPLYDSDGTWDYYDEDRTITQNVKISGSYSGGIEGSFSNLRVTGTGTAEIDNLEDDRFDRSYRAEMDSPATATWGPGSSLALTGIQGQFELVSVNSSEIPDAEWLDPEGFSFPDPTMVCTPSPSVQMLEDIACFITTDPPDVGTRDTTFQANVTVTGFDPDATLEYEWRFRRGTTSDPAANVSADVANPTFTWFDATFPDDYYTLSVKVTDGGHVARCAKHFSFGVEPNNPPECLDVAIVPFPPPAGLPVLGVVATARDADGDPLLYHYNLYRGLERQASEAEDQGDSYVFSVPGGLQPGPYTASALVSDGKQQVACVFHFVVPGFPGGEAAAECGPVGIMYLDDYAVEMKSLAIDAAIEAALAEGGPEYSLIVSHRQRLIDQFGEEGFAQIDYLLNNMRDIAETCPFVLIVGDDDMVPIPVLPNPAPDGDVLYTDDPYGDTDHDSLTVADIPVARIPDGDSLDLVLTQLSPSDALPEGGNLTVSSTDWPYIGQLASRAFGSDRTLLWSLPMIHTDLSPSQVDVGWDFLSLHGSRSYGGAWWGEKPSLPVAFTLDQADSQGVVLGGACYGAYTIGRTPEDTIALRFLANGSRAYVGTRSIIWHPIGEDVLSRHAAVFQLAFWESLARGEAPLAAFMEGKAQMASKVRSRSGMPHEQKMLHDFTYYGKP